MDRANPNSPCLRGPMRARAHAPAAPLLCPACYVVAYKGKGCENRGLESVTGLLHSPCLHRVRRGFLTESLGRQSVRASRLQRSLGLAAALSARRWVDRRQGNRGAIRWRATLSRVKQWQDSGSDARISSAILACTIKQRGRCYRSVTLCRDRGKPVSRSCEIR